MRFYYNPRKAAQAAAFLVKLNGGQMNVISLMKMLYLSDRESLIGRGKPITGDIMVSMPHGPVLSRIYDDIKSELEENPGARRPWFDYLAERTANTVSLRDPNPSTKELSQFERRILERIYSEYGGLSPWDLRNFTHSLPEYKDPQGSSLEIDPRIILKETGWSDEEIREAVADNAHEVLLHKICG